MWDAPSHPHHCPVCTLTPSPLPQIHLPPSYLCPATLSHPPSHSHLCPGCTFTPSPLPGHTLTPSFLLRMLAPSPLPGMNPCTLSQPHPHTFTSVSPIFAPAGPTITPSPLLGLHPYSASPLPGFHLHPCPVLTINPCPVLPSLCPVSCI